MMTKSGGYMCVFDLEDPTGRVNVVLFPKVFNQYGALIKEDQVVVVEGRLDIRREEVTLTANSVKSLSLDTMIATAKEENFYDDTEKLPKSLPKIMIAREKKVEVPGEEDGDQGFSHGRVLDEGPDDVLDVPSPKSSMATIAHSPEGSFVIEIPAGTPSTVLQKIKLLLESAQGGTDTVELRFLNGDTSKKIKIPFGVRFEPEVRQKILASF
jgi:hypothetical protein